MVSDQHRNPAISSVEGLDAARDAFARHDWTDACARFAEVDRTEPLDAADLERFATAAFLIGREEDSTAIRTRAHHAWLERGDAPGAARTAFWIGFDMMHLGEHARGSGWMARARRVLEESEADCVERGYLYMAEGLGRVGAGDVEGAHGAFTRADEIGRRFDDTDLVTFARNGRGRALLRMGRTAEGVALLDEAMVAVTLGEVSPPMMGDIYCSMIEGCHEIFDLHRAREWTDALGDWCGSHPDLVPYRGQCLVRRAELMRLYGAWPDAMAESERARERLSHPPGQPAVGAALYLQAELHRLRGELAQADEAYREASRWGRKPRPGIALLQLAQGETAGAAATIRRLLDEAGDRATRAGLLPAAVEILLAAGDVAAARAAADELAGLALDLDSPWLRAIALQAEGAVRLAEDDPRSALDALRRAWTAWQELAVPYEAARVRLLIGLACRRLSDEESACLEVEAARGVFLDLGATVDAARADALLPPEPSVATRLTPREVQVLRLVAGGRTNRAIAGELGISEKTVARHLSNIFTKLGLSSRSAATAYAYRQGLVHG